MLVNHLNLTEAEIEILDMIAKQIFKRYDESIGLPMRMHPTSYLEHLMVKGLISVYNNRDLKDRFFNLSRYGLEVVERLMIAGIVDIHYKRR